LPGPIVIVAPGVAASIAGWMLVNGQPELQTVFVAAEAGPAASATAAEANAPAVKMRSVRPMCRPP
jgi:hypothetical protein